MKTLNERVNDAFVKAAVEASSRYSEIINENLSLVQYFFAAGWEARQKEIYQQKDWEDIKGKTQPIAGCRHFSPGGKCCVEVEETLPILSCPDEGRTHSPHDWCTDRATGGNPWHYPGAQKGSRVDKMNNGPPEGWECWPTCQACKVRNHKMEEDRLREEELADLTRRVRKVEKKLPVAKCLGNDATHVAHDWYTDYPTIHQKLWHCPGVEKKIAHKHYKYTWYCAHCSHKISSYYRHEPVPERNSCGPCRECGVTATHYLVKDETTHD